MHRLLVLTVLLMRRVDLSLAQPEGFMPTVASRRLLAISALIALACHADSMSIASLCLGETNRSVIAVGQSSSFATPTHC